MQVMAQGWLVYELTKSTLMLGYLGVAAGVPAILVTLLGGALADRLNRKYLLIATSLLSAALLFILTLLDISGRVNAWHVIFITGAISFISGLDLPTRQAIFPGFIDRKDMMSAVALNSIVWQGSRMIFPAFGGLLIAFYGTGIVFLICALGFVAMASVMATLRVASPEAPLHSTMNQVLEGLGFILRNRNFLILISMSYISMLFGSSYMQLMPAFSELLNAGSSGYGYLLSVTGIGSIIGTLIVGALKKPVKSGWIILGGSFMSCLSIYLFALIVDLAYSINIAMLAAFCIAMFASLFLITAMTVMQLEVPDRLRGRVMGLHGITYSLMPLGGLLSGTLATIYSAPAAISISTTFYLLYIILVATTQRRYLNFQ